MSWVSESKDRHVQIDTEFCRITHEEPLSLPIPIGDLGELLGEKLFTQDEASLVVHSETIAKHPRLCRAYIDIVLASRGVREDPRHDHITITAAANAISVLNYGSRSGIFPFRFIDVRDWSGIRVPGANLNYAMLAHCNFNDADLSGSSLIHATLFNAQLRRTNLTGVKMYEMAMFEIQPRSDKPNVQPTKLGIHPGGTIMASGYVDGVIRVFNFKAAEDICYLSVHTDMIQSLTFNTDGSYLCSVSLDNSLRIWDMMTYQCKLIVQLDCSPSPWAYAIAFNPEGSSIVVLRNHNTVGILNLDTSDWTTTFEHESAQSVDWCPTGSHILTYTSSGDMCIWNIETQLCTTRFRSEGPTYHHIHAKFTLDGSKVVVNRTETVSIFSSATGERVALLSKHSTNVSAFTLDCRYIYVPSGRWLFVFDLETYQCVTRVVDTYGADKVFLAENSPHLITYCKRPPIVKIFDTTSFRSIVPTVAKDYQSYSTLTFSPDCRHLIAVVSGESVYLRFLNVMTGHCDLVIPLLDHYGEIYRLSCSPDMRWIAYVDGYSNEIEIYDVCERKSTVTLNEHTESVSNIVFDPHGTILASTARNTGEDHETNGDIRLWDTATWKSQVLHGHTDQVLKLCFSPGSKVLVSLSADNTIRLWNVDTAECSMTLTDGSAAKYRSVSYSPCGRFLASLHSDHISIWDVSEGKCMSMSDYNFTSSEIKFLRNGRVLTVGNSYHILDMFSGEFLGLDTRWTESTYMSADGSLMATDLSQYCRNGLYLWQFPKDAWTSRIVFEDPKVVNISADMQVLGFVANQVNKSCIVALATDQDGSVYIRSGIPVDSPSILQGHSDLVTCIGSSSDGRYLASGSRDTTVRLWDMKSNQCHTVFAGHAGAVSCLQFSSDDQFIATGSYDTTVRLWSLADSKCVGQFEGHTSPVKRLQLSPDHKWIASIESNGHAIYVWDITSSMRSFVLDQHTEEVFDIQFSSDSRYLASGSHDDTIRVWEMKTGTCIATLQGHTDCLKCFALSSDGMTIVSGSEDKTIRAWNVTTSECTRILKGHTGYIRSVCLTPDDRCIISASNDHVIHIWDVVTGAMLHQLLGHTGAVVSIKLVYYDAQADSTLVSTSMDGTVRVWTVFKMTTRIAYSPELTGIFGAQATMDLHGADLTGAVLESTFAKVIEQYGAKFSQKLEEKE